mgnify:CR=1 FL=1
MPPSAQTPFPSVASVGLQNHRAFSVHSKRFRPSRPCSPIYLYCCRFWVLLASNRSFNWYSQKGPKGGWPPNMP